MKHYVARPIGLSSLLWSWLRGVNDPKNWRKTCARCGFTGQAHYNIIGPTICRRFKPMPGPFRRE